MDETTDILAAWKQSLADAKPAALATVVLLEGSGYRRPGARMLVLGDGQTVGSVSGGCIDRDIVYRAGAVITSGHPALVRYDAVSEEEAGPGASLGCGGEVHILIEPANQTSLAALDWLRDRRKGGVIAMVIERHNADLPAGWRAALDETGQTHGGRWPEELLREARAALESGQSRHARHSTSGGWMDVFLEVVHPPAELLIFGAGADVVPLASLGRGLGWRVTVVDMRSSPAAAGRTFDADSVIRSTADELDRVEIPNGSAVILMNHNWNNDLAALRRLRAASTRYIGVLGPRRRTQRLLAKLDSAAPPADRLHFPAGLDIGAETPREIALSIIGEIVCQLRGGGGGALRDKEGPIHSAADTPCAAS
jgi:xanthine/CO dehydrogenase XdhC/CoxF family maturation factor